ncbi:hypothetical protein [Streptomyces lunalinharesii]|uniref:Uncharacterized protein n=1 Tax=Streptomyces lunalinharesii TaxID=333384 RepID=A0ABN3T7S8_9ACTN
MIAAAEAGGHQVVGGLILDRVAADGRLAAWRLQLLQRLQARNQREDANALTVTPQALDDFFARFEPPADDEQAIVYTGDVDAVHAPAHR